RGDAVLDDPVGADQNDAGYASVAELAVPQLELRAAEADRAVLGVRHRGALHRQLGGAGVQGGAADALEAAAFDGYLRAVQRLHSGERGVAHLDRLHKPRPRRISMARRPERRITERRISREPPSM